MKKYSKMLLTLVCVGILLASSSLSAKCDDSSKDHKRDHKRSERDHKRDHKRSNQREQECNCRCAPEVLRLIKRNHVYHTLFKALNPFVPTLTNFLQNAQSSSGNYPALLAEAEQIAALFPTGRVVITAADGLVIVDTSKGPLNTAANAQAGAAPATFAQTINVNHNSRVAILDAQIWPCGVGVETKFSNSVNATQNYVAIRLGPYLNSIGTARISVNEGTIPPSE